MVYLAANSNGLGRRALGHHWQTSLIDDDMMFATELSPLRAIGAGLIPAGGGRTLAESMLARSHSIQSYSASKNFTVDPWFLKNQFATAALGALPFYPQQRHCESCLMVWKISKHPLNAQQAHLAVRPTLS